MDALPVEVLEDIFALACTDGGHAGCALSLTSKGVRAVSRTARFHSIALIAYPSHLASFLALYERESDAALGSKPKVAHLHLTIPATVVQYGGTYFSQDAAEWDWASSSPGQAGAIPGAAAIPAHERGLFLPDPPAAVYGPPGRPKRPRYVRYTPAYAAALGTLMRLLSVDLDTLVLQYGIGGNADKGAEKPRFLNQPFPRLRELTVLGLPDLRELLVHGATFAELDTVPVLFPALTHLHLVRKGLLTWPYVDLHMLGTHAPRVARLRCSCFRNAVGHLRAALHASARRDTPLPVMLASSMAASLWIPLGGQEDPSQEPAEPPSRERPYTSLRDIVLQSDPASREADRLYKVQESLRCFDDLCRDRGINVTLVKPHDKSFEDWGTDIRGEWVDRLNGGEGCWKDIRETSTEGGYSFYGLQP